MNARQWIGLVIVVAVVAASFLAQRAQDGGEPTGPTHGCEGARGEGRRAPTLCLLNAERARHRLRPLRENGALARAAERHARDMAGRDYFAHESPEGTGPHDRIRRAGYRDARLTGENLAQGQGAAGAPSSIVDGWMHSPGHRANILRRGFREIGIAVHEEDGLATYVTTFGARR